MRGQGNDWESNVDVANGREGMEGAGGAEGWMGGGGGCRGVAARAADGEFQRVSLGVREMKCELGEWRGKRCSAE